MRLVHIVPGRGAGFTTTRLRRCLFVAAVVAAVLSSVVALILSVVAVPTGSASGLCSDNSQCGTGYVCLRPRPEETSGRCYLESITHFSYFCSRLFKDSNPEEASDLISCQDGRRCGWNGECDDRCNALDDDLNCVSIGQSCTESTICETGLLCVKGKNKCLLPDGSLCREDANCAGGTCLLPDYTDMYGIGKKCATLPGQKRDEACDLNADGAQQCTANLMCLAKHYDALKTVVHDSPTCQNRCKTDCTLGQQTCEFLNGELQCAALVRESCATLPCASGLVCDEASKTCLVPDRKPCKDPTDCLKGECQNNVCGAQLLLGENCLVNGTPCVAPLICSPLYVGPIRPADVTYTCSKPCDTDCIIPEECVQIVVEGQPTTSQCRFSLPEHP